MMDIIGTMQMTGGTWGVAGSLLTLGFCVGVALFALWLYRFVKDSPENKKLLAWGLGLVIGVSLLSGVSWGVSNMMGVRFGSSGMMGTMMQQMMQNTDMQEMMHNTVDDTIQNHDEHHPDQITNPAT